MPHLEFDIDLCKGCAHCVMACPMDLLYIDESRTNAKGCHPVATTDSGSCLGCGMCAGMCPCHVITVVRS